MKNQRKISLTILLLFFSLGIVVAQEKMNTKGQQKGVVIIKFSVDQTSTLDRVHKNTLEKGKMHFSKSEGYVKTGITAIDKCNKKLRATSMKRVFRPAGKFEEKHRKFGLHLWYEITYDNSIPVDEAIRLYQKSYPVEVAHARHKIEYADGYTHQSKTVTISENTLPKKNTNSSSFNGAPNDPEYSKQWHYNNTGNTGGTLGSDIKLEKAWEIEKGDPRVIVAVMDQPVQVDHPDLKKNMWVNENEIPGNGIDDDNNGYIDDINGYDYVNDTGNINGMEHGTHVAGTIAAETNNGIGVAGVAGGTGNGDGVRIMTCGILGFGIGGFEESFVYAADHGAVISNNSWTFNLNSDQSDITATKAGINYFIANAGGVNKAMTGGLVVFAMGNDGFEYSDSFPDREASILHVGATDHSDKKSSFSNFGTWGELFAPGGSGKRGIPKEDVLSTLDKSTYGYLSGTSMATPHVSGVAALLVSHHYGKLTPDQVKTLLQGGADPIDNLNPGYIDKLGAGRVNAWASLSARYENIPVNVVLDARTETSIQIKWNKISTADSYQIRYKKVGNPNWIMVSDISTNIYNIQGITKGTAYIFQVQSKDASETSLYSERKVFWSDLNNPKIPVNIHITEKRRRIASVNWDIVEGVSGYEIAYKKSEEQKWTIFLPRGNSKEKLKNLTDATLYQVKVRAVYGDIYSNYSPIVTFTTGAPVCSDFDPWDPNKVYPSASFWVEGSLVAHNNHIYENNHWTQNQEPGVSSAWKKLYPCNNGSGNIAPTVTIDSPTNGQVFNQETLVAIMLSANATDADGTIASIQFEVNGIALTQGNNLDWTPTSFGNQTIKVTVTDDKGATATDQISISIKQITDNQPPVVVIAQPTDGQQFEQEVLSAITLSANASDPDGSIASIQFEVNGTSLAVGSNINWLPSDYGNYIIKVTATDDKNASASAEISISIEKPVVVGDCNGIPAWNPATVYPSSGGVKVSHKENIYENKWWTQNNEPGTGGPWGPWEFLAPCATAKIDAFEGLESTKVGLNSITNTMEILLPQKSNGMVKITMYTIDGRLSKKLTHTFFGKGTHQLFFDVVDMTQGFYLLKIERNGGATEIKKVMMAK
ncbi:S8 family serine peptidase [Aquimarina sp. 2201CG1-2-11]|uniref:S8 family serine peptidase n=1 Tax=Aquimarina discodermiae TaxID=3231043 RepID=UPI0034628106